MGPYSGTWSFDSSGSATVKRLSVKSSKGSFGALRGFGLVHYTERGVHPGAAFIFGNAVVFIWSRAVITRYVCCEGWGPPTAVSPGLLIGSCCDGRVWGVWDSPHQHAARQPPTSPLFLQLGFQHFCTKCGLSLICS